MSNTVLKCHPLITSIDINGSTYVPDGSYLITVPSADATNIMRGANAPQQQGPIMLQQPPTDPTT
jgi:hypothetical protein